jgi:hypothetical protein
MALRPRTVVLAAALLVVAFWATVYFLAYLQVGEPDADPFRMTLLVSASEPNANDGNLTDVVLWVAVANGEPKPRWSGVELGLEHPTGNVTLWIPRVDVDDLDGNGRVSEGDLISLPGLTSEQAGGTVTLWRDGRAIGTVRI